MDDDLSTHLSTMKKRGAFDNALVIVMADHGHRFAKLRETHQVLSSPSHLIISPIGRVTGHVYSL